MQVPGKERTKLITFGISHFCEKARWALDWHSVPYTEVCWPPGVHLRLARKMGVPKSSVPILAVGDKFIQESSRIVDWAERSGTGVRHSLIAEGEPEEAEAIEKRLDSIAAIQTRRYLYGAILPKHHHLVKPALFMNTSTLHRLQGNLMWPVTRKRIMQIYDANATTVSDSRDTLEQELDWLDRRLAEGRQFLVGDRFSRVDLAAASILAPLARPPKLQQYSSMELPPEVLDIVGQWSKRPTIQWVNGLYTDYRPLYQ